MKDYMKGMMLALALALAILLSTYVIFQNIIGKFCISSSNCFYDKGMNDCKSNLAGNFSDAKCICRVLSCALR